MLQLEDHDRGGTNSKQTKTKTASSGIRTRKRDHASVPNIYDRDTRRLPASNYQMQGALATELLNLLNKNLIKYIVMKQTLID